MNLELPVDQARERLRRLIRAESVKFGDFVLSSGARSSVYVDLRLTTTSPEGAFLAARLLLDRMADLEVDAVGGPTLGADPIVGAMAALGFLRGTPYPTFIVRKASKDHGARQLIEGHLQPGWRVVVLDDTVTRGGSILHGIRAAREAGAEVVCALTIVDREEGGSEALAAEGVPLGALFTLEDIVNAPGE